MKSAGLVEFSGTNFWTRNQNNKLNLEVEVVLSIVNPY